MLTYKPVKLHISQMRQMVKERWPDTAQDGVLVEGNFNRKVYAFKISNEYEMGNEPNINKSKYMPHLRSDDPDFFIGRSTIDGQTLIQHETWGNGQWGDETLSSTDDHSVLFSMAYNDKGIYCFIRVLDDYHENAANSMWNGDSIQTHFSNGKGNRDLLRNYYLTGIENNTKEAIANIEAGWGSDIVAIKRDTINKETHYEIFLERDSFEEGWKYYNNGIGFNKWPPSSKSEGAEFKDIRFGFVVNDGDEQTPGQKGWTGFGADGIVFGKDVPSLGIIEFVEKCQSLQKYPYLKLNQTLKQKNYL